MRASENFGAAEGARFTHRQLVEVQERRYSNGGGGATQCVANIRNKTCAALPVPCWYSSSSAPRINKLSWSGEKERQREVKRGQDQNLLCASCSFRLESRFAVGTTHGFRGTYAI